MTTQEAILTSIGITVAIVIVAVVFGAIAGAVYDEVSGDRHRREVYSRNFGGRNYME